MAAPLITTNDYYEFENKEKAIEYVYSLVNSNGAELLPRTTIQQLMDGFIEKEKYYGWDGREYTPCKKCGNKGNPEKTADKCAKCRKRRDAAKHKVERDLKVIREKNKEITNYVYPNAANLEPIPIAAPLTPIMALTTSDHIEEPLRGINGIIESIPEAFVAASEIKNAIEPPIIDSGADDAQWLAEDPNDIDYVDDYVNIS